MRGNASLINFAYAQLQKLNTERNLAKPDWSTHPINELLELFRQEVKEFDAATLSRYHPGGADYAAIMDEAVDVANTAMFIYEWAERNKP